MVLVGYYVDLIFIYLVILVSFSIIELVCKWLKHFKAKEKKRKESRISHISGEIEKCSLVPRSYINFVCVYGQFLLYVKDEIKILSVHLNIKSSNNTGLCPNNFEFIVIF